MVTVVFAHDVGQLFHTLHPIGHHSGHACLFQHGAVIVAVAHSQCAFMGDAQPVGQGQQSAALVHSFGRDLNVVRGALHHFHAFQRIEPRQGRLGRFRVLKEHAEFLDLMGVAAHPLRRVPHDVEPAVVGLLCLGGEAEQAALTLSHPLLGQVVPDDHTITEHAQGALKLLIQGKHLPGFFRREHLPNQADWLTGPADRSIRIAAVHRRQRVLAQVPDGSPVGGDGIADKLEYLGEAFCTEEEMRLASLANFPPLNFCCYPAVPDQYLVPSCPWWEATEEAITEMKKLASEAGDKVLLRYLALYEKWQGKLLAKQIAKLLHTSRHAKVVDLLEKKLAREAQNYPKRRFTGEEGTQIRKIQEQAMKRKKILEAEGKRASLLREEPFFYARDSVEYKVHLMIWGTRGKERVVEVETFKISRTQRQ